MLKKCNRCKNGVVDTGNNDLPCDCLKGSSALFNIAGFEGLVSGAESRRHFFNGSPEPLSGRCGKEILASSLPGRNKDIEQLKKLINKFYDIIETFEPEETSQIKGLYTFAHNLHTLTSKMLAK